MDIDRERAQIWQAMDIGPLWLLRGSDDPLLDEAAQEAAAPPVQPASAPSASGGRPVPDAPASAPPSRSRSSSGAPAASGAAAQPCAPAAQMPPDLAQAIASADWETLRTLALKCACCPFAKSRQHVVFGQGEPGPKLVVVGEAPGSEEDLQGKPFVGKSGQLLTAMLDALNIVRGEGAAILNVLKCRPPLNRDPHPDEVACCAHYLRRQLELLNPEVIFVSGRYAAQTLLGLQPGASLGRLRGKVHEVDVAGRRVKAVATYHPSYLLRSPDAKAKAWEDLCLLRRVMTEAGIAPAPRAKTW